MRVKGEEQRKGEKYFIPIRQAEMYQIIIVHRRITLIIMIRGAIIIFHLRVLIITVQAIETQIIVRLEMTLEAEILTAGGDNVVL
jgi:hypothetical protein